MQETVPVSAINKSRPWTPKGLGLFKKFRKSTEDVKTIQIILSGSSDPDDKDFPSSDFGKVCHAHLFELKSDLQYLESYLLANAKDFKLNYIIIDEAGNTKPFYLRTYDEVYKKISELKGKAQINFWPSHYATLEEWNTEVDLTITPQVMERREQLQALVKKFNLNQK